MANDAGLLADCLAMLTAGNRTPQQAAQSLAAAIGTYVKSCQLTGGITISTCTGLTDGQGKAVTGNAAGTISGGGLT